MRQESVAAGMLGPQHDTEPTSQPLTVVATHNFASSCTDPNSKAHDAAVNDCDSISLREFPCAASSAEEVSCKSTRTIKHKPRHHYHLGRTKREARSPDVSLLYGRSGVIPLIRS